MDHFIDDRGINADYDFYTVISLMLLAGELNWRWGMFIYGCC